jgi:hypothetical protein
MLFGDGLAVQVKTQCSESKLNYVVTITHIPPPPDWKPPPGWKPVDTKKRSTISKLMWKHSHSIFRIRTAS